MTDLKALQFPIGEFVSPENVTDAEYAAAVAIIANFPKVLRQALSQATDIQLDTPYRPDGWTVRQVVHHLADSHINSFTRIKLALTETQPTIKPYDEAAWANLPDATTRIDSSLLLLEGLHERWTLLMQSLTAAQKRATFYHPDWKHVWVLQEVMVFYAWHCEHHLAHIKLVVK